MGKTCLLESQVPETCGKVWRTKDLLWGREDQINKIFKWTGSNTSMHPAEVPTWVLRELVLPLWSHSQLWKFYADGWRSRGLKKTSVNSVFKDKKEEPGNYRPPSLTLFPGKIKETSLETTFKHMKDKKGVITMNLQRENHADWQKHRGQKKTQM